MTTPALADIIFPEQANHNFSRILGGLRRSNLSITNRLRSICQDAAFVDDVAAALKLPLVANERCGSWYIDPARKAASAYFKSTDGHAGQWKFSTRRLNLHLLELIGKHDGCIIIDSTRRGKRMPDALSKTVPIWCSVLNRALFPEDPSSHRLFVPPNVVSPSEASQIEARLPDFVASFLALAIDPQPLRRQLGDRPLRPLWITQEDHLDFLDHYYSSISAGAGADSAAAAGGGDGDGPGEVVAAGRSKPFPFHPVVCCTSSKRVLGVGAEIGEAGGYIQGAGDDTENWALGLTAEVFWRHKEELLAASEAELPELITQLVAAGSNADPGGKEAAGRELKRVAPGIFIGTLGARERALSDSAGPCVVTLVPRSTEQSSWVKSPTHMEVGLGKNKAASRLLRDALPQICGFVSRFLEKRLGNGAGISLEKSVIVLCESGKDLSVGVALALYCWCFDAAGNARSVDDRASFNKTAIRVKLGHIMTEMPNANPSRATLQSVNSFLMDWRK